MIVVEGKKTRELEASELRDLISRYAGVTVDLGTGDGRFAYRYAAAHPDRLVVGIDPVAEAMSELSARARRKPERGGRPNVLYAVASVEHMPPQLERIADEIFVNLPWGSLMHGIILGDDGVLHGVAHLGKPAARVQVILNTRIFEDPVPLEARDLPDLTPEYVHENLGPAFARHAMDIREARYFDADEVAAMKTTWAKRLSHRRPPRSVLIEAQMRSNGADER
jgi:16S rRNA (adenine(1408)-N(1))-methyltransferase